MTPNPSLIKLGFAPEDRVVIIHADDLGMCHAANVAFADLVEFGLVTCGSVMVPCPWFPELAAYSRAHPEADLGVHLTLNSEYEDYRWRPISTCDPASGLLDADGYQPRNVEALHAHVSPEAAVGELRAQLDRALAAGIDVTHVDTHMGAVVHPGIAPGYVALALEHRIPGLFPRMKPELAHSQGIDPQTAAALGGQLAGLEAAGLPLIDHVASLALNGSADLLNQYKQAFDALEPGLTHFIIHPAAPGIDVEVITASAWARIADYQMMLSRELKAHLVANGIHLIGYRQLRAVMRAALGEPVAAAGSDD